jgi:hypothetical protein
MLEFAIFIVIMIVVSLIGKAKQQQAKSGGAPSPRVLKLMERIQAQQAAFAPPAPPHHVPPPQRKLPTPRADTDTKVRELMNAGNEVAAIRLLSEEQGMGILEAQQHARALVALPGRNPASAQYAPKPESAEDTPFVGSTAFAESIFDLDRDEDTWARAGGSIRHRGALADRQESTASGTEHEPGQLIAT